MNKTINVVDYRNLPKETLMNIIKKHHTEIADEAYVYITEMYPDWLCEIEEAFAKYGINYQTRLSVNSETGMCSINVI